MKIKKFIQFIPVIFLSFLLGTFSCNKFDELKSPVDGFNVILNYDIFETFVTIRFVDAPTGELIGAKNDEKVKIEITGNGANAVVDQLGNHNTEFNSVFGLVNLALNPNNPWKPSAKNIISLNFKATNENYKGVSLEINIDTIGRYSFDIYLEKTNVDKIGLKEYSYFLPLNENGGLIQEFNFYSTGNEAQLTLPLGTRFLNNEGKIVLAEKIKFNVKVFLTLGKAPVPMGLIQNMKTINGQISKKAIDFYRIAEISFFDENDNEITPENNNIVIQLKIQGNFYNPVEKRNLQENDEIVSFQYNTSSKLWEENESTLIQNDSSGSYAETKYNNSRYLAFGNATNTCNLSGNFEFNLTNTFEELPVGGRVNLYRKRDNKYISNFNFQVENVKSEINYNFISIEQEPVKFIVQNQSSYNPFSAEPSLFYSDTSCGNNSVLLPVSLTSKRAQINGQLNIQTYSTLQAAGLELYADIYNSSNNSRMYRKKIVLNSSLSEFTITSGLIAGVDVYIKLVPVLNYFQLNSYPEKILFNTSSGPFDWEFELDYEDISKEITFDFDLDESFENRNLSIRADFLNLKTNKVDFSTTLIVSANNPITSTKVVLDKSTSYQINLKRVQNKEKFMALPYFLKVNPKTENSIIYQAELLPLVKKEVTANITLLCGSSIIYPSLSGMFKTVWDDEWKEIDIQNGQFTQVFEIGATYKIGTVFDGVLISTVYFIESTNIDLIMEMKGDFCDSMGW